MSVEGGSIGGAGGIGGGGGIATGVIGGNLARGLEIGPVMGLADISPIVNEGPFRGSIADFNPIKPVAPGLTVSSVIAEAEAVLSEAQKPAIYSFVIPSETRNLPRWEIATSSLDKLETPRNDEMVVFGVKPQVFPQVEPMVVSITRPNGLEYPKTENALAVQTSSQPKAESRVSAGVTQAEAVSAQPAAKEQAVEKVIEEVDTKETVKTQDLEQIEKVRLGLVEDTPKTQTREDELNQAIELAAIEAKVLGIEGIEGWRIVNKLIPQHSGDRSETLNEEDPQNTILDGSLESVKEDIKTRKFASTEEAKRFAFAVNRKYRPEKKGEQDDITEEEHQRVHRDHKHPSRRPLQILERRIVRKGKQASLVQDPEPATVQEAAQSKREASLKELNPALTEVFRG